MKTVQKTKKRYSNLDKASSLYDSYNVVRAADMVVHQIQQQGSIRVNYA